MALGGDNGGGSGTREAAARVRALVQRTSETDREKRAARRALNAVVSDLVSHANIGNREGVLDLCKRTRRAAEALVAAVEKSSAADDAATEAEGTFYREHVVPAATSVLEALWERSGAAADAEQVPLRVEDVEGVALFSAVDEVWTPLVVCGSPSLVSVESVVLVRRRREDGSPAYAVLGTVLQADGAQQKEVLLAQPTDCELFDEEVEAARPKTEEESEEEEE
jgi:hypothetical protein